MPKLRSSLHPMLSLILAAPLACGGSTEPQPEDPSGNIRVTTETTGQALDADGYTVTISGQGEQQLGANATLLLEDLEPGSYSVQVAGLAGNCALEGDNPRTVTVTDGATAGVTLAVECVLMHPAGAIATSIPMDLRPYGVAISPTGVIYTALIGSDLLVRGDLTQRTFGPTVTVGPTPPHVAFTPDGRRLYATLQYGRGVAVVDPVTNTSLATIPLIADGFNLIVSPDGSRVYATDADGRLYAINTMTNAIVGAPLNVGAAANGLAFAPGGATLYVSSRDAGTITAVSTATFAITRTYDVGGMPQRLAVSPDGATLYAANEVNGLDVVDVESGEATSVDFDAAGYGLGITPDGEQLYLLFAQAGYGVVLDRATLEPVTTIITGGNPRNVAFSLGGDQAVIATESAVVFVH